MDLMGKEYISALMQWICVATFDYQRISLNALARILGQPQVTTIF